VPFEARPRHDAHEVYFQNERVKHWLRGASKPASVPGNGHGESFQQLMDDARARSKRLHKDQLDIEGRTKFYAYRTARPFERTLRQEDPWQGFERGELAALEPDEEDEYGSLVYDYCTIMGKAWEFGYLEVRFHIDKQVATVKTDHLVKIDETEANKRKVRASMNAKYGVSSGSPAQTAASVDGVQAMSPTPSPKSMKSSRSTPSLRSTAQTVRFARRKSNARR
jgi:hypothetical protein